MLVEFSSIEALVQLELRLAGVVGGIRLVVLIHEWLVHCQMRFFRLLIRKNSISRDNASIILPFDA